MRILGPLLKASVVAAIVFAVAWIRIPRIASSLETVIRLFIGFGILILILSLMIGFPIAYMMEKCRMIRWWSSTLAGAAVGALLSAPFTFQPLNGTAKVDNPFTVSFSPWNRDAPGFTDNIPFSQADALGSMTFGVIVGAALGLAFWFFYSRGARPSTRDGGQS